MSSLIIIQARMSSTRLPGKILRPIWGGKNLLDLQINRIQELGIPFALATTTNSSDDILVSWANANKVEVYRGYEQDVLKRFVDCAHFFGSRHLIRICSDNPFLQLDQIPHYLERIESGVDYISYCNSQDTPAIKTHWGLFVEGVSLSGLEKALEWLKEYPERAFYSEHVTNFIYGNSNLFQVELEIASEIIANRNDLRFTIDTEEDFENMSKLLEALGGPEKGLDEIIETADNYPLLLERMKKGIRLFSK